MRAEGFPSLSCIILNGGLELHPSIAALVAGLEAAAARSSPPLSARSRRRAGSPPPAAASTAASQRKIDTAIELMDEPCRHRGCCLRSSTFRSPTVVTPQMFDLSAARPGPRRPQAHRAARGRRRPHPQGGGRLLQRNVAELTILGDEPRDPRPRSRTRRRPVRREGAEPADQRAVRPVRRAVRRTAQAQGRTVEQARETIHDVSYFGTMLVHNGMVDGMVSGAAHTTAHTVRPAFEIIKTAARHHDRVAASS